MFDPSTNPAQWAERQLLPLLQASRLSPISQATRAVTDGDGVQRVIGAAFAPAVRQSTLSLRAARIEDAQLLHQWQCDPRTRRFAVTQGVPAWEDHLRWFTGKLADPKARFSIAEAGGIACGVIRLDPSRATPPPGAPQRPWREISILSAPEFYGCGVASRALKNLQAQHPDETLVARVLPGNIASQRLFASAGFRPYAPELLFWDASDPHHTTTGIA